MSSSGKDNPVSPSVPEMEGIILCHWGGGVSCFEDIPLVEFRYPVFISMPGGNTLGDKGLCWCVPRLLSATESFRLLFMNNAGGGGDRCRRI